MPPDDHPRSPSGRAPQWVIDEAARRTTATTDWRTWEQSSTLPAYQPPGRRRHPGLRLIATLLSVALTVTLLGRVGTGLPDAWMSTWSDLTEQRDVPEDIPALADAAFMSDEGRAIFYDARPQIVDVKQVADLCEKPHSEGGRAEVESLEIGGCYIGDGTGDGAIVLAAPADSRLAHGLVTVAAHEMLHAAWDRMGLLEKEDLVPLLEAEVAALDAGNPIHDQISWSVGGHERARPTELFAYVGTQVWRDGGLDPRLEEIYGRFISDRAGLVAVYTG